MDQTRLARAFEVVRDQVRRGDVPVAVMGVADRQGVMRVDAFSGSDGPHAAPDSRLMIASITKPIMATAILQLVEAGRLSLSAPLVDYLPEFAPEPPGPNLPGRDLITTWHLLTHTSGIVDPPLPGPPPWLDRAQLLALALRPPLQFVPGTQYRYASVTFRLLGELLRRLGGLDYPDSLREHIFLPLGMADTSFAFDADEPRPGRAVWPRFQAAPPEHNDEVVRAFTGLADPGGGLWSTAGDLLRFGRAILNGGELDGVRIVGPRSVELMTREHTTAVREHGVPERDPGYGLGWAVRGLGGRVPLSRAAFGHGGATGSLLVVDPELDLVFVYLANQWGGPSRPPEEALGAVAAAAG